MPALFRGVGLREIEIAQAGVALSVVGRGRVRSRSVGEEGGREAGPEQAGGNEFSLASEGLEGMRVVATPWERDTERERGQRIIKCSAVSHE